MLGSAVRRVLIAALAGVVVMGGVACGGDDDDEGSTGSTASSTTAAPTTTLDEETRKEEEAKAAYLAYWDAFERASAQPVDPTSRELLERMTGDQARLVVRNLEEMRASGQAARRPTNSQSRHQVSATELQADGSVRIVDCQVDDVIVYDTNTGAVINDAVITNLVRATMVQDGNAWKVALAERTKKWPGAVECAG
jgi:hypothetical protein